MYPWRTTTLLQKEAELFFFFSFLCVFVCTLSPSRPSQTHKLVRFANNPRTHPFFPLSLAFTFSPCTHQSTLQWEPTRPMASFLLFLAVSLFLSSHTIVETARMDSKHILIRSFCTLMRDHACATSPAPCSQQKKKKADLDRVPCFFVPFMVVGLRRCQGGRSQHTCRNTPIQTPTPFNTLLTNVIIHPSCPFFITILVNSCA